MFGRKKSDTVEVETMNPVPDSGGSPVGASGSVPAGSDGPEVSMPASAVTHESRSGSQWYNCDKSVVIVGLTDRVQFVLKRFFFCKYCLCPFCADQQMLAAPLSSARALTVTTGRNTFKLLRALLTVASMLSAILTVIILASGDDNSNAPWITLGVTLPLFNAIAYVVWLYMPITTVSFLNKGAMGVAGYLEGMVPTSVADDYPEEWWRRVEAAQGLPSATTSEEFTTDKSVVRCCLLGVGYDMLTIRAHRFTAYRFRRLFPCLPAEITRETGLLKATSYVESGAVGRFTPFLLAAIAGLGGGIGLHAALTKKATQADPKPDNTVPTLMMVLGIVAFLVFLALWWISNRTIITVGIDTGLHTSCFGLCYGTRHDITVHVNASQAVDSLKASLAGARTGGSAPVSDDRLIQHKGTFVGAYRELDVKKDSVWSRTTPKNACMARITGRNVRYAALHQNISYVGAIAPGGFGITVTFCSLLSLGIILFALKGKIGDWVEYIAFVLWAAALVAVLVWYLSREMLISVAVPNSIEVGGEQMGFDNNSSPFAIAVAAGLRTAEKEVWRISNRLATASGEVAGPAVSV